MFVVIRRVRKIANKLFISQLHKAKQIGTKMMICHHYVTSKKFRKGKKSKKESYMRSLRGTNILQKLLKITLQKTSSLKMRNAQT